MRKPTGLTVGMYYAKYINCFYKVGPSYFTTGSAMVVNILFP